VCSEAILEHSIDIRVCESNELTVPRPSQHSLCILGWILDCDLHPLSELFRNQKSGKRRKNLYFILARALVGSQIYCKY